MNIAHVQNQRIGMVAACHERVSDARNFACRPRHERDASPGFCQGDGHSHP
jgi:hypothetical protein